VLDAIQRTAERGQILGEARRTAASRVELPRVQT